MQALRLLSVGKAAVVETSKPKLRPDYVLVKTSAVALNPTDWKHMGFVNVACTMGCDFSGVVEEVGPDVTVKWTKGDRICGVLHGSNETQPEDGAFGEYLVAKGDLSLRPPKDWSDEEAAAIGMGVCTVGQGIYQAMELPWPDKPTSEKIPIFIYGGSSGMGAYGIQFAKASGLEVYTTCSPRNNDYVKSLGADHVFDYNAPNIGAEIRKASNNSIFYAWDTIAEGNSTQICADALSSESKSPAGLKPKYSNTLRANCPRDDVDSYRTLMYSIYGEPFAKAGRPLDARPEDFEFMKKFIVSAQKIIDDGKLKPHNLDSRTGGLEGILDGLNDMKDGKVSAKKLVYKL